MIPFELIQNDRVSCLKIWFEKRRVHLRIKRYLMMSIFRYMNSNLNKNFCLDYLQNPFLILLLILFANTVCALTSMDNEDQALNHKSFILEKSQGRTKKPDVLKYPIIVNDFRIKDSMRGVAAIDDYVYVATVNGGIPYDGALKIINTANKTNPILIGNLELGNNMHYLGDMAVIDDFAYITSKHQTKFDLKIIDVTNKTAPVLIGRLDSDIGLGQIAIAGDYAYIRGSISTVAHTLEIVNIAAKTAPILVGELKPFINKEAGGMTIAGDYAYICSSWNSRGGINGGLEIINVTNKASPVLVGNINLEDLNALDVAVMGDYAYVSCSNVDGSITGLKIINITDKTTPILSGSFSKNDVDVSLITIMMDKYIYSSAGDIVVIEDPTTLTLFGKIQGLSSYQRLAITNDYAYATNYYDSKSLSTIRIKDNAPVVSDLYKSVTKNSTVKFCAKDFIDKFTDIDRDRLTKIQIISLPNNGILKLSGTIVTIDQEIVVEDLGDLTFEPNFNWTGETHFNWKGFDGFEYSFDPAKVNISVVATLSLVWVGSLATGSIANGVTVVGKYAYVTDRDEGLKIIDVSTKTSPVLVGNLSVEGKAYGITIAGNYAYIAAFDGGLKIINIATPSTPTLVSSLKTDGNAYGVTVVGEYAYVTDSKGLKIINIINPLAPFLVGGIDTYGEARGVAVVDDYAYVADGDKGLKIIDITDKTTPVLVGNLETDGSAYDVVIVDKYAYLADWDKGLKIIDITDKAKPSLIGSLTTDGRAIGIEVVENNMFLADGVNGGLKIINIAVPQAPVLIGEEITTSETRAVDVVENYVYLADGARGLEIIRFRNEAPVVSDVSKSGIEDASVTFNAKDFIDKFFDMDGDSLVKIKIMNLPKHGFLKLSKNNVIANQEIVVGHLNALSFHPESNWHGSTSFGWKGSDRLLYSNGPADVIITLAAAKSSSSEDSNGGQNYRQPFCDEYWWSCYIVGPVIVVGSVVATITTSVVLYLHKHKMCCFRPKNYLSINS